MAAKKSGKKPRRAARVDGKRRASPAASTSAPAVDAPRTEGQRQLLAVAGSHAEVAEAVGCSKQLVSYWRRGEKTPSARNRTRLHELYGIAPAAWVTGPSSAEPAPARKAKRQTRAAPPATPPPDPDRKLSTLEHTEELIRETRRMRLDPNLLPSERVRIMGDESKLLATLARLEERREAERTRIEDLIVREHPSWQRIRGVLRWLAEQLPAELADELLARLEEAVEGA